MEYFSTFLTGFGNVVTKELKKQIADAKIQILLDGLIVFTTTQPAQKISELPFLNNNFILIKSLKGEGIGQLLENVNFPELPKDDPNFNVIYSKENQIERMSGVLFDKFREDLGRKIHSSFSPQGKLEFWIIERNEGFMFFGLRLKKDSKSYLEKGQLRSELTYLMCLLSDPKADDIFLDPFAGSGAIAIERLKFPFQKVLAGDNNGELSSKLKEKSQKERLPITVGKWDALNLANFENESIDKIVTDPPWGLHFGKNLDLQKFYAQMLKELYRILKHTSLVVLLIANKELIEKLIREQARFEILNRHSTLVNGQKAGVYVLKKA